MPDDFNELLKRKTLKQELLATLEQKPLDLDFDKLVAKDTGLEFEDLRDVLRKVFNINETILLEQSTANAGLMGWLNRFSTARRNKRYYKAQKKDYETGKRRKIVVAEGDSWFQFPVFVKDIIDWLPKKEFNIYSIAYGGDWLTNIIYEGKYIEELSIHVPDYFLISGSGNDMVGSNKLALMVTPQPISDDEVKKIFERWKNPSDDPELIEGRRYLTSVFFSFILLMKAQYWLMFRNLHKSQKFRNTMIITQGYANALPSYKYHWSQFYNLQPLVNYFVDTGKWLKRPLVIRNIPDDRQQHRKIVRAMIHELNTMFMQLAQTFENVYHIDARPAVFDDGDWFDELHLKSYGFKRVAATYADLMRRWNHPEERDKIEKVVAVKGR
jgi:hypothetical protein